MAFDWSSYAVGGAMRPDSFTGMQPSFRDSLQSMISAAPPSIAHDLRVMSGYRSVARQQQLFDASDRTGRMVARPGHSRHNMGLAADFKYLSPAAQTWAHQNAAQFGLTFPMSWEPWHVEPIGARKRAAAAVTDLPAVVPTPTARPDPAAPKVATAPSLNSFASLAAAGPITSAPLGAASFAPTAPMALAGAPMASAPLASLLSQAAAPAAPAGSLGAPVQGIMRSLDPGTIAPDVSHPDAFGWVQPSTVGQVMAPGVTPTGQFSTAGIADRLSAPASLSTPTSPMGVMGDRVTGLGDMAVMGDRVAPMSMPSPERMASIAPPSLSISAPVTPATGYAVAQDPSTMTAFGGVPSPSRPDNRPAPLGTGLPPVSAPITASIPALQPVSLPSLLATPIMMPSVPAVAVPAPRVTPRAVSRAAPQTRAAAPTISRPTAGDVYSGLADSGVASDGSKVSRNDLGGISITNGFGATTINNAAGESMADWSGLGSTIGAPHASISGSKLGMAAGGLLGAAAAGPVGALAGGYVGSRLGPTAAAPGRPATGFAGSPWSGGILGGLAGGILGGPIGLGLGALLGSRITSGVGFGPNAFMGAFPAAPAAPANPGGGGINMGLMNSLSPGERASIGGTLSSGGMTGLW